MQLELQIEWMFRLVMVADLSKKGMVGEKHRGEDFLKEAGLTFFNIIVLLH